MADTFINDVNGKFKVPLKNDDDKTIAYFRRFLQS